MGIEITEEVIKQANDYISIGRKMKFVDDSVVLCFDKLNLKVNDEPIPPVFMENTERKSRILMGFFVKEYLGIDISESVTDDYEYMLDRPSYDNFASSHIFNQIERMKRCNSVGIKDKCFDIMSDYKDLEKRMNTEIYGRMQAQNDFLMRFAQYNDAINSPEYMDNLMKAFETAREELEQYKNIRNKSIGE